MQSTTTRNTALPFGITKARAAFILVLALCLTAVLWRTNAAVQTNCLTLQVPVVTHGINTQTGQSDRSQPQRVYGCGRCLPVSFGGLLCVSWSRPRVGSAFGDPLDARLRTSPRRDQ